MPEDRRAGPRPDFFIVGAFKAGTTALYSYLRQHPQIFMPFLKEPLFFGSDLTRRYGRMTLEEYLALFRAARDGHRIGEASAWYLYSQTAAREIHDFSPSAQIIVMLRNPIDVMYAQHRQLMFGVAEDLTDFAEALDAEPARRRGERLPPGPLRVENLYYRESVRFADQLERYLAVFGRERMHVIVYDDLRADTQGVYQRVLDFLGVDSDFRASFAVVNENKRVLLPSLQRLVYQPPRPLLRAVRRLRRFPAMHWLRSAVLKVNSRAERRPPMDLALRSRLQKEFAPDIERLGLLIGRDLSSWLTQDG
jgi:hypothetical protein